MNGLDTPVHYSLHAASTEYIVQIVWEFLSWRIGDAERGLVAVPGHMSEKNAFLHLILLFLLFSSDLFLFVPVASDAPIVSLF